MKASTVLGCLLLVGCVHHVRTDVMRGYPKPPVQTLSYGYQERSPGLFWLWVRDRSILSTAKVVLKCGTCVIENIPGQFYTVRVVK